jgi:imidazoleglycerol-phosphate dehydratase/histidinol-phosphatase
MKKRVLFIDRDGTLIVEPPITYQVDTLEQLEFLPGVIRNLYFIKKNLDFELVIVTNQDGLGTDCYPQENFDNVQNKMLEIFSNEDITFDEILIDKSFPEENKPTRKPNIGLLTRYFSKEYDLENSYVIGDRETDMQLAKNLGCKGILISTNTNEANDYKTFDSWDKICDFLYAGERKISISRTTNETNIAIDLSIDGKGKTEISTGLKFFDHMLEQIGKHSNISLKIKVEGDLHVDEHHTIEDTAIALGDALFQSLGNKRGIERYGFCLPMDDCLCQTALDFGGRSWLIFNSDFKREYVGDFPTEMAFHFFKSLSDAAHMNLNIKAEGDNDHHKLESIFKSFARALKMAVKRDIYNYNLPTTKGLL